MFFSLCYPVEDQTCYNRHDGEVLVAPLRSGFGFQIDGKSSNDVQRLPRVSFSAAESCFSLKLNVNGLPLGLRLDSIWAKSLFVIEASDDHGTLLGAHNRNVGRCQQVAWGDFIVEVNGCNNGDAMSEHIAHSDCLELIIVRPQIFVVVVERTNCEESLGLEFKYWQGGASLLVVAMYEAGAVCRNNCDISPGDRVVNVNGVGKSTDMLLGALFTGARLELVIYRCPDLTPTRSNQH